MTRDEFTKWTHKFGMATSFILLILMFAFPITISFIYGVWPPMSKIWPACVVLLLMMAPYWPAETLSYMTTMGPGALYMSYVTGNVSNLRMPATVGTINTLGLEPNTDECHTMAIIACGASNFTTVILLFIGMILSVPLQPILTAEVLQPAFNFAIPALFGGVVAQSVLKGKSLFCKYLIPLGVCLFFAYCTKVESAYYLLVTVAVGVIVCYLFDYKFAHKADSAS